MIKVRLSWIHIALALFLVSSLLSLSSPAGAASVPIPATGSPPSANPKDTPVAEWLITWTSSSSYVFNTPPEPDGAYFNSNYDLTQSGSTIVRQYANNSWDDASFTWHVTDAYDDSWLAEWGAPADCPPSLWESGNFNWSITDPDRYNGLNHVLNVTTEQLGGGTWQASVNFDTLLGTNNVYAFTNVSHGDFTECGVTTYPPGQNLTSTYTPTWSACILSIPASLEGDAEGDDFTYHDEFTGTPSGNCQNMDLTGTTATLSVDVTVRRLLGTDLTVNHLEVTQGLQDDANSIPLVQGRRTVVRAFIGLGTSQDPIPGVTATLMGYSDSTELGMVQPFNPNGQITAPLSPDWMNINDTLNFELPLAWTTLPSLTLTVKVNPSRTVQEANYDNDEDSVDVNTRACKGMSIGYTVINYNPPGGFNPPTASANIKDGQLFMQKVYPLYEKGLVYQRSSIGLSLLTNLNDDDNSGTLKTILADALAASSPPRPQYIFGWLPPLAYAKNGRGIIGGNAAFGNDTENPNRWRRTFAHEVGHNFGLLHPPEDDPLTTAGAHWFDVYDRVIKPVPASTGSKDLLDFMVPERLEQEAWVSPTNYRRLMDKLCPVGGAAALSLSSPSTVGDNLIISGSVSNTTPVTGALDPIFRLSTIETSPMTAGSQYCVNLKDDSGNLLSYFCFDQGFEDDADTPAEAATFSMAVPYPDGLNQVDLVQTSSGKVLSSQVASAHSPSVTVTYPNASGSTLSGNQTITWSGSDADHDPLTYAILYSRDNGTTWTGVGADITDTSYDMDFSGLPGTTGASGLIKVLVSDGFFSAEDTSDNPFTVANKPPTAVILSPSSGATFYTGPQIILEGSGVDLQDGSLSDSDLSWTSSLDGALGSGQVLETTLSPGLHTITLTVTDSHGLTATDSIQVTVVQSTPENLLFLPLVMR